MDKKELLKFLTFLHDSEGLKRLLRHSWLSSGRRESVAEHSWRLALMAMVLGPKLKVNTEKVIKMVTIHDLCEVHAGDHWPFKKKLANKQELEGVGLIEIIKNLPKESAREILDLWEEYEFRQTSEAKLAQALDKMEVLIQHNEAKLKTWNKKEMTLNLYYGDEICDFNQIIKTLKEIIKDESVKKVKKG